MNRQSLVRTGRNRCAENARRNSANFFLRVSFTNLAVRANAGVNIVKIFYMKLNKEISKFRRRLFSPRICDLLIGVAVYAFLPKHL